MKNRSRSGGGPRSLKSILWRRIQSSKLDLSSLSVDEVVQHLRLNYPDYRRLQLQSFTRTVSQSLDCLKSTARSEQCETDEDMDSTGTTIPSSRDLGRKRRRNSDFGEERLIRIESEHLQKSKKKFVSLTPSCSSVDEDKGGSDTDDATFEPKIDLMKSMIRSNYAAASSKTVADKVEEKIFEVEVDDKAKKIDSAAANWTDNAKTNYVKNSKVLPAIEAKKEEGSKFSDFGGMDGILEELRMEVIVPCFYHPHLLKWLGVKPMTGILLHGPPGCGKTKLAHAIANEAKVPFYKISATQVISGVSGESEENIRSLFSKAYRTAPSIVFIDEIDAIGSKRENLQREMEKRVVTQLLTCMDDMHQTHGDLSSVDSNLSSSEKVSGHVLVIGATNRPDALDPALRRPGRFDREIALCVPDENARVEILSVLTQNLRLEGTLDLRKIAKATSGFVGADLAEVVNKAGNLAVKRILHEMNSKHHKEQEGVENAFDRLKNYPLQAEELKGLSITASDFDEACSVVQPSSTREGFSRIPDIKWEDVGGLKPLREEFDRHVIRRIKCPEDYEAFGVDCASGILLYGPPGCGKTLIAKAVANGAGANFIHVKGPELLSRYVGDSELAVRTIFSRARTAAPCIIFFDEIDALTTERGKDGGWVVERLLNQLLIELDGADQRRGVYVIGATNRLEVMDRAVLRPGRLGKHLYVPLPGPDDRVQILRALGRKKPLATDVDLDAIGRSEACDNLSGADLAEVVNEAAMLAMKDNDEALCLGVSPGKQRAIETSHFERALEKITPSVSVKQNRDYKVVSQQFKLA